MSQAKNELKKAEPMDIMASFTREQIDLIKNTVAVGTTDDELKLFIYQCNKTGLDPLSRQIHCLKRNTKRFEDGVWKTVGVATIQTGIDGYRTLAARTGEYAGNDDPIYDTEENEYPGKATVTVYRMIAGQRVAFTASARWSEYAQVSRGKDSNGNPIEKVGPMWQKMPYLMLAKCAEALALRKAFPQELSGVYTNEEMSQADNDSLPIQAQVKVSETVTAPSPAIEGTPLQPITKVVCTECGNELSAAEASWCKTHDLPNLCISCQRARNKPAINPAANPEPGQVQTIPAAPAEDKIDIDEIPF